jgi:beta-phosphoglucomutase
MSENRDICDEKRDEIVKSIIFDFDGVILESVSVKTEAFRSLFSFAPQHVEEIVRFHQDNGGMSRFDKFDYIYRNILREPLPDQKRRNLSDEFSSLVFKKILEAPFVPGARELIEKIYLSIPLFIVSATPQNELDAIITQRGLSPFFKRIYGSPRKKTDCIWEIVMSMDISPDAIIFIGDAKNDLDAALKTGVRFIGRTRQGDPDIFTGCPGVEGHISDLTDLEVYLGAGI